MRGLAKYLIPSFAEILFVALFLTLALSAGPWMLMDCDTGYHIVAGDQMIEARSIPTHDIFSYRAPPPRWIAFEWLSQVIMAATHRLGGLSGVVALFAFLLALAFYTLFKTVRLSGGDLLVAITVVLLAVATSALHWLARPHVFSLLLFVFWLYLLERRRLRGAGALWPLPLTMLIWTNLHGAFLVGLALLGVHFAGQLWRAWPGRGADSMPARREARTLGLVTLACLAAALCNPNGYLNLVHPFRLLSSRFIMDHIGEFLSPDFHDAWTLPFKATLLLLLFLFMLTPRRAQLEEILLVLVFANLALSSQRHIPLFAIISAPVLARQLDALVAETRVGVLARLRARSLAYAELDGAGRGWPWIAVAALVVAVMVQRGVVDYEFDARRKPVAAARFLLSEPIPGRMFNEYEFGDYIIYSAFPRYRVFIDGRNDMYGEAAMKEYYQVKDLEPGWQQVLDRHQVSWVIFTARSPLSELLPARDDWKLIYGDKVANIFLRDTPENDALIEKYRGTRPAPQIDEAGSGTD